MPAPVQTRPSSRIPPHPGAPPDTFFPALLGWLGSGLAIGGVYAPLMEVNRKTLSLWEANGGYIILFLACLGLLSMALRSHVMRLIAALLLLGYTAYGYLYLGSQDRHGMLIHLREAWLMLAGGGICLVVSAFLASSLKAKGKEHAEKLERYEAAIRRAAAAQAKAAAARPTAG